MPIRLVLATAPIDAKPEKDTYFAIQAADGQVSLSLDGKPVSALQHFSMWGASPAVVWPFSLSVEHNCGFSQQTFLFASGPVESASQLLKTKFPGYSNPVIFTSYQPKQILKNSVSFPEAGKAITYKISGIPGELKIEKAE